MKYRAIHSADRVFKKKIGVASLFCPFISYRVFRMKVRAQVIEGPKRNTFLAIAILTHIVSVLRILAAS